MYFNARQKNINSAPVPQKAWTFPPCGALAKEKKHKIYTYFNARQKKKKTMRVARQGKKNLGGLFLARRGAPISICFKKKEYAYIIMKMSFKKMNASFSPVHLKLPKISKTGNIYKCFVNN